MHIYIKTYEYYIKTHIFGKPLLNLDRIFTMGGVLLFCLASRVSLLYRRMKDFLAGVDWGEQISAQLV